MRARACVAKMVAYESHDLGWILFVGPQPVTTLGLDCLVRQVYWIHSLEPKFHSYSSLLFLILLILGTWPTCHKDLVKCNDFFVMAVISFAQIPAFCIYLGIRIVAIPHELGVPVEDIIYYKFFSVTKFGAFISRQLSDVKAPNWNNYTWK